MRKHLSQFCALASLLILLSGCNTVTEMVEANIPVRETGSPKIVISLRAQEAYLYRGKVLVASSRISSGRESHRTPTGRFRVISKDIDHASSIYGDYVGASGKVVKANVDRRRHRKPRGARYVGAPMPFYLEFTPSYGLHQGYLPGEPASHGCIRLPYWKARQFYQIARIGTPVIVKP